MSRRTFLTGLAAGYCLLPSSAWPQATENVHFNVADYDRERILAAAEEALHSHPQTIASLPAPRKMESPHLYFSEDVEWFRTVGGDFEHRPGHSNPAAYSQHRDALVKMNGIIAACVAAWRITSESKYAQHAMAHLRAWFLDAKTRMEPSLDHAACVPPSTDGTYRGVEDSIMLAETARAASFLCSYNGVATQEEAAALRAWFASFTTWMNDSKPGFIAREMKDRTAICWTLQAAEMARFTRNGALQLACLHRFRDNLLRQMNLDGQFPAELHRPDAYAASIFTLDCLSMTCEAVSTPWIACGISTFQMAAVCGRQLLTCSLPLKIEARGVCPRMRNASRTGPFASQVFCLQAVLTAVRNTSRFGNACRRNRRSRSC